ncbi:MAG: glycoside hydrolase family 25 protein [Ruminococcus sp.]|nr:glycoside hydrolase family 25 protein [Ruminococcus sp.]
MANIKCLDVSEWQGTIDWKKVVSAGYSYAILRAGFGRSDTQKDKDFEKNYTNAKAAGVKLGAYWYSYAVDKADAIKEAKACLSVIKGKSFELPVFYDMEDSSMSKLGKAKLTEIAKAFCDALINGGVRAGVYSNPNWFNNYLDYNELRKLYPIWLAQYYKEPQYDCDVWQYTSEGKVAGIVGNVDLNVIINEGIIKKNTSTTASVNNFETAALQSLLLIARSLGIITQNITPIDNKSGKMTKAAILQMKNYLGLKEDYSISLDFVRKTYEAILEKSEASRGDYNKDGKLDIRDVTDIQKKLAGIGE